jgi:hypothetical protein
MLELLQLNRILLDGILLSLVLSAIVLGSLKYNPRLWLQDYPKAIRERVPPLSPREVRHRAVLVVLVLTVLIGGLALEALRLRNDQPGGLPFGTAYLSIFIFLAVFNLFDALVLDLLILTWLKPRFAVLPGTEGLEHLLYDYRKQLADFLKGFIFCAVASLPFAAIAAF